MGDGRWEMGVGVAAKKLKKLGGSGWNLTHRNPVV